MVRILLPSPSGARLAIDHSPEILAGILRDAFGGDGAAWYREELERTADVIAASGKVVEVNTGAIARGWLDDAYPSPAFRALLRARGVRFVLSADAHAAEALDGAFDRFASVDGLLDVSDVEGFLGHLHANRKM